MERKITIFCSVTIFLISLGIFASMLLLNLSSDLRGHIDIIQGVINGSSPPPNFLYYLTVYVVALFKNDVLYLRASTCVVLAVSVMLKFLMTLHIIKEMNVHPGTNKTRFLPHILAAVLCFCFSLPNLLNGNYYLGQLSPNVWHNSTLIFMMPFALLLFWKSWVQLQQPSRSNALLITLLLIINLLIKPSYVMVFIVVFPLFSLMKFGLQRTFFQNLIPVLLAAAFLLAEYYLIFEWNSNTVYDRGDSSTIQISPFLVWKKFSNNIPLSIGLSILFPATFLTAYRNSQKFSGLLLYAMANYIIAVSIFIVFAESGERLFHGNFSWQNIACAYLLFTVIAGLWNTQIQKGDRSTKNYFVLGAFALHFICGLAYILRLLTRDTIF